MLEAQPQLADSCGCLGVRVNPQVGHGTNPNVSTAGAISKFGIGLAANREALIKAFAAHSFLTMLHCHVGSQGVTPMLTVQGLRVIIDLAKHINERVGRKQVTTLDVGGGYVQPTTRRYPSSATCSLA